MASIKVPSNGNIANNSNRKLPNNSNVTNNVHSRNLVYTLQTTLMLKMLSKIFPLHSWDSTWLHKNVRINGSYSFEGINLSYKGQSLGRGHEHEWEIRVDPIWAERWVEKINTVYTDISNSNLNQNSLPQSQPTTALPASEFTWNNLKFRSQAEIEIAKALEKRGILFFPNAKCRIHNRVNVTETKEADFLVFYKGVVRILEVDGRTYHQDPSADYRRDRMFAREGIQSSRFTASECLNNADEVVEEFLQLFNSFCSTIHPLNNKAQSTVMEVPYTARSVQQAAHVDDIPF